PGAAAADPARRATLTTTPAGYRLDVGPEVVDAHRFTAHVDAALDRGAADAAAAASALSAALGLWRGAALADVAGAAWALATAARLEEVRALAVEAKVDADLAGGHHDRLVPELEALVAAHPLRERLWCQLMTALYRGGRQADALRAF